MNSQTKPTKPLHIVGCGDIGRRVAARLRAAGQAVSGLVASPVSCAALRAAGIEAVEANLDDPASLPGTALDGVQVFYFAPPPKQGRTDSRMRNWLAALGATRPAKIVAISTTGVYGDVGGDWVTEDTPLAPGADRAWRRVDMETAVRQWGRQHDVPVVILRVPGIYSCERLPLERLRKGLPVLTPDEAGYTNRIHADDLAAIAIAAMQRAPADSVYNVSDGQPGTMTDYFNTIADHFGLPRPPQISLAEATTRVSAGMLSYLRESRRISNSKMREELGVTLQYPDLQAGLQDCKRD
ncbi:MAG: NAD(P)H-binding protein [Granulosicoccaceae bacterium]|jgi:nucleoside-diphosphate-sugar epimerase